MEPVSPAKPATYQDVLDAPEHLIAEILDGELVLSPRPAVAATSVANLLHTDLSAAFSRGRGGPGGWHILYEAEVHVVDNVLVPDIAGWRRERLPVLPDAAFLEIAPDWVCEVLSPSTEKRDRTQKLRIYMNAGVRDVWLVHPRRRTLEAFTARDGQWVLTATLADGDRARVSPFHALEIDLATLWVDLPLHAREEVAEYHVGR